MKKHLIKMAILIPGLAFLIWWGWIGNFSFKSDSFYPFGPLEDYYNLAAGQKSLGFARRAVTVEEGTKNLVLTEDALIQFQLAIIEGEIRPHAEAVFSPGGTILRSRLTIALGPGEKPLADIESRIENGVLDYRFSLGTLSRVIQKQIPEEGPILISGLIPWLAHQRELPLGRPIFFNIFDPARLEFRPASLTIIDVTAQSEEKKVYKLALFVDPYQTEIWINADGHLVSQRASGLDIGPDLITQPDFLAQAKAKLDSPYKPGIFDHIPKNFLESIISQGVGSLWPSEVPRDQ
ncbi:MAG: hypothetical protein LBK52_06910 [Deltaproteobacteria bacterium]|jgi:hypothetical protein|nr:hypothetical protein [Deltaproteobacteria bacterium]